MVQANATTGMEEALAELQKVAPGAPFLALGQTVFWDEPMKAGALQKSKRLGYDRRLVAGVHDTDYFAKLPGARSTSGAFKMVPHNDTRTRGLWSAAAEFSSLFGSETVVTRDTLAHAGLRLEKITQGRPNMLDEATEAWGWRGIVSLSEDPPITAETPLNELLPELQKTLDWAIDETLKCVAEPERVLARERADRLRAAISDAAADDISLAEFYRRLLPELYSFTAGEQVEIETTATSQLLRFNSRTWDLPRFELADLFIRPETSAQACKAYNDGIAGSEMYQLDRFGTGAIPFDLVIPGLGRGTVRVAPRAIVIMTPTPQFISLRQPIRSISELAGAVERKFGPDCVLTGKAVTLIGMLAREFVFVFHEGASSYVKYSRAFHGLLRDAGVDMALNPILRVRYQTWDALDHCHTWLELPEPLQHPFGAEEICAPSFAKRWREVAAEQGSLLEELSALRSPLELIRFLQRTVKGSWKALSDEYMELHERLESLDEEIRVLKGRRVKAYGELRALRQQRVEAEAAKGRHWRAAIFEKSPTEADWAERTRLTEQVERVVSEVAHTQHEIRSLLRQQSEIVSAPEVRSVHERRRAIELEAELKRLRLIRDAVVVSKGLQKSSYRPSAWWYPLVCPDGGWFQETVERAECYLEPLLP